MVLGEIDRCRAAVQYGLDLAEREGLFVWKLLLYAQATYNELMVGNVPMARKQLNLMQHVATFGGDLFIFLMLGAWADLIEGWSNKRSKNVSRRELFWR